MSEFMGNQLNPAILEPWRRTAVASLGLYFHFIRLAFLKFLAYRLRYYTGVVSYTIFVSGHYYLYTALFASRVADAGGATIGGLTLGELELDMVLVLLIPDVKSCGLPRSRSQHDAIHG